MKVAVIIVNFNGNKDTLECLKSLLKIDARGIELTTIVVDNASREPFSVDKNKYSKIGLKLIQNTENLGFTGGNNTGIKEALENGADYVLLLNNDTLVSKDFLEKLLEFAMEKNAEIVSPKIYFAKGFEFHKDRYASSQLGKVIWYGGGNLDLDNVIGSHRGVDEVDKGQYDEAEPTDSITGCCALIKSDVFGKVGLLDENYFLYYEDSDFSLRAAQKGISSYYLPSSVIWHKNAGSTGGSGSDVQDYYISRNRLYFGMKYAPARAKLALLREGIRNVFEGRQWQRAGAIDYFMGRMGKTNRF